MKKKNIDITEFLLWIGILILLNIIASQYFFRIDLTEDKRYTISGTSKDILKKLDDVMYVEVYLTGALPSDYERLKRATREMLDEFRVYAGNKVQYKFFDPNQEEDPQKKSRIYEYLRTKGVNPVQIPSPDGIKTVFPSALIVYKEKEAPVSLLNAGAGISQAEMVNQSVEGLEYQFMSAFRQLTSKSRKSIAFVEGHGEYNKYETFDIENTLARFYDIYPLDLKKTKSLENYDALIIAGPETKYSEEEKYALDQYILKGGNVLFFLDPVQIDIDSIGEAGTLAIPFGHNLDDLLFKYGVRLNSNLIQDLHSMSMPMVIGEVQGKPQVVPMPWRYYPLLNNFGNHPTVKNMDVILAKFVGTLDSVKAPGVKKTPLVFSSKFAKVFNAPVRIDFNEARKKTDPAEFNQGPFTVSYLLEGNFTSLYKNRILPVTDPGFVQEGKGGKVFIFSDADVIKNVQERKGQQVRQMPLPQGNKDLVTNMIDYMLDEQGLIRLRSKEIKLRPLDKQKVKEERVPFQMLNLVLPVALVVLFGLLRFYIRKRKYTRF